MPSSADLFVEPIPSVDDVSWLRIPFGHLATPILPSVAPRRERVFHIPLTLRAFWPKGHGAPSFGPDAMSRPEPDAPHPSEPPPVAADVTRRRNAGVWLTSLVAMALLGGTGWELTDRHLERRAAQGVADSWLGLRTCMLGSRRDRSVAPAERIRLTQLQQRHQDAKQAWPERCRPLAEAFDTARVQPSVRDRFGSLPAAVPIVDAPQDRHEELMTLVRTLDQAELPLASPGAGDVPPPPEVRRPLLAGARLIPIGRTGSLGEVGLWLDEHRKAGRLLLRDGDARQLCELDEAWTTIDCQSVPLTPKTAAGRIRLSVTDGVVSLLRADDGPDPGFYDGATGGLLYGTSYFGAQANAEAGLVRILTAKTDGPRGRVKHHRWVELAAGKRPRRRSLKAVPRRARTLLVGDHVYWTERETGGDVMRGLPLREAEKKQKKKASAPPTLATLPPRSRPIARCEAPGEMRVLFANGLEDRHYTLIRFPRPGDPTAVKAIDLGRLTGVPDMQCLGPITELSRIRLGQLTRWRCEGDACRQELTGELPQDRAGTHVALGSLGKTMAMLWQRDDDAMRLRVGAPDALHDMPDQLVFDTPTEGGFEAIALRFVGGHERALALMQDPSMQVYALRIDADGTVTPLKK